MSNSANMLSHFACGNLTTILEFFHPCELPRTTHQSGNTIFKTRNGRYFVGQNKVGKQLSEQLNAILWPYRPSSELIGPLSIEILYVRPYLKSMSKQEKSQDPLCNTKRPDCDNIAKGILDAMQACHYYIDDAQIYKLSISKLFSKNYGLGIIIKQ